MVTFLSFCAFSSAQNLTIKGTVVDSNGIPIPGVNVIVKGTQTGAATDFTGEYSINATANATLTFSYIGYQIQKIVLSGQSKVDMILQEDLTSLDEVIVVGYGTQKKKEITGAVSRVESETVEKLATASVTDALQGQVAGVNIQASNGSPGQTANVQIRGVNSISGGLGPLWVVDGIPYSGDPGLSSNEIETIDILKDASASIYGVRASGGVILVTTKRGKAGTMKVNFDSYYGWQKISTGISKANTAEVLYINQIEQLAVADGAQLWNPLLDNSKALYNETDWIGDLTVDNAPMQNYNLRVSGGKEDLTYSVNANYFSQDGVLISSAFDRLSLRANSFFKKNKFTMFSSIGLKRSTRDKEPWALLYEAIKLPPYREGLNPNQDVVISEGTNPEQIYGMARALQETRQNEENGFNASLDLNYEIIKGLKLQARLGANISNTFDEIHIPKFKAFNSDGEEIPGGEEIAQLTNQQTLWRNWTMEYIASFEKNVGKHFFKALAGYTMEERTYRWFKAGKDDFLSNDITQLSGGSLNPSASGQKNESSLQGILGRIQYNYDGKYLFWASVRRDGSSRFGTDNRYGTFPSASVGWNISDELFFKNSSLSNIVGDLKFRATIGTSGNDGIPDYSTEANIIPQLDYVLGPGDQDEISLGASQRTYANPNVKWETSVSRNFGIDLNMFKGKLNFTADYYMVDKEDMLNLVSIPTSSGSTEPVIMNVGNMTNEGIELTAGYRKKDKEFQYSVTGTFTKNTNVVTKTDLESSTLFKGTPNIYRGSDPTTVLKEGLAAGTFYLIPTDGLIDTDEELAYYTGLGGVQDPQKGDLKYVDTNGDDAITDDDRVNMGSGAPDFEAGLNLDFSYKNLDLNIQLYGTYGNKVFNGAKLYAYLGKTHKDLVYSWSEFNPTSTIPTPRQTIEHDNIRTRSDYFLEDGSYLRIRNIQLGYSFGKDVLSKLKISKMRIYLSSQNPITFTKYTGFDPEVGNDGLFLRGVDRANYPVSSPYRVGLQLEF